MIPMPLLQTVAQEANSKETHNLLEESRKKYKKLALNSLAIISAFGFGFLYLKYLERGMSPWAVVGALVAFCVISTIRTTVTSDFWGMMSILFFETVAMTGAFLVIPLFWDYAYVALVVFVLLLWGDSGAYAELENNLEIRFFRSAHLYVNKITTAAVFMMVIFYIPILSSHKQIISEPLFGKFFSFSTGFVKAIVPDFDPHATVAGLARSMVETQVKQEPAFAQIPKPMQNSVIEKSVAGTLEGLSKSLDMTIAPDESVESAAYRFVTKTIEGWRVRFGGWFYVAWALLMFLLVRSLGFLFSLAVSFIALIVFYLLVAMKAIEIRGEMRSKEVASL